MYGEDGIDLKIKENKAYYDTICCRLNIDGETSRNGWKVYERILALRIKPIQRQGTTSSALGTRQILTTCALFVASINNKQMSLSGSLVQGSCLQLTQLLTETNVRFTEFLEYGSFVLDMLKSSEENKDNFKVLMEKFNVGKLIFEKFKGLWDNTRLAYQDVEETEDSDEEHSYSENKNRLLMKFAWIFFLNSKSRIIGNGAAAADLAKSFHILVTCLHWVVLRSYRAKLNSEDLLKFLCQSAKMEITELTNARKQLNTFVETLRGESSLLRGVVTAPLTDEGVLGSRFLRKNVTSLSREYANVHLVSVWEIDEMFFLNSVISNQICTPAKTRPKTNRDCIIFEKNLSSTLSDNKNNDRLDRSNMSKRLNLGPAAKRQRTMSGDDLTRMLMQTPVSAAVKARKWFTQIMTVLAEHPSDNLKRYFAACGGKNPTKMILNLARTLPRRHINSRNKMCTSSSSSSSSSSTSPASKYVAVSSSQTSLFSSSKKSSSSSPSNESEEVEEKKEENAEDDMASSKISKALMISPMLAPRGKRVDHRLERCRSCCVRLYFNTLEALLVTEEQRLGISNHQALLCNMAFHRALLACCMEVALKSCNYVTLAFPCTLNTFEVSPFDLCKMVESFIRHQPSLPMLLVKHLGYVEEQIVESMAWHGPHIKAQEGHNQDTPDGLPSKSVELLVRKTQKLAMERTVKLAMMLKLPVQIIEKLRDTIEWAIDHARSLLYDRHLDNIVLCVLYGVAKVLRVKPEVSFKKIIAAHKKCNGAKLEVIRHVVMNSPNERAPSSSSSTSSTVMKKKGSKNSKKRKKETRKVESKIQDNNNHVNDEVMMTPKKTSSSADTKENETCDAVGGDGSSPRQIQRTNVFVMPRRVSMTPRTRALYAFGESPRRDLMRINRAVNPTIPIPSISEIFARESSDKNGANDNDAYLKNLHNKNCGGGGDDSHK